MRLLFWHVHALLEELLTQEDTLGLEGTLPFEMRHLSNSLVHHDLVGFIGLEEDDVERYTEKQQTTEKHR